ncbi:hypothetical protein L0Y65_04435 [Candidatus Micrarchaeota archaeon]|nr:hypothetical protein [Candidatus Micrarchaeota archaeon]
MSRSEGFFVIAPCTTANGVEIRLNGRRIDLARAGAAFAKLGEVAGSSPVVLLVKMGGYSISVYGSGRMMVKGERKPTDKAAQDLAKKILSALEAEGALI